ncbi:GDSL esterase/lipase At5g55050 [Impatiens glandulifera]|uniref:GDSL esterase/lipase At5g55050 n=1 Tax=Impatiens glandulifera TaxID=253017 RepID=UPI001FB189AB|nr:GDSL esterase/lipase At5g55050 [Impatiens glandulifera]
MGMILGNGFFVFVVLLFVTVGFKLCFAQNPTAMYVFGDSLVDVGNNNYLKLSIAKADFPHNGLDFSTHKPTGRFSNGKNAADFLAEKVGLASSPPPYLSLKNSKPKVGSAFPITGVSFASGGAGIFNSTDLVYKQSIPFTLQVGYFGVVYQDLVKQMGSNATQQHLSKALFTIIIGSNDIFGYSGDVAKNMSPQQYVDKMNSDFEGLLKRLYGLGARKFIIAGVGKVGCCPAQRVQNNTGGCLEGHNTMALQFNQGLKSMLQNLKSQLTDINYSYLEVYSVFESFLQTPSVYGFNETKAACCGLGNLNAQIPCVPISIYCANRNDHLFWDLYHPTEKAARILIDVFFQGMDPMVIPMNVNKLIGL